MKRFEFRLQRVLAFREMEAEWLKEEYLARRLDRVDAEVALEGIQNRRHTILSQPVNSLPEHQALQMLLESIDDEERAQKSVLSVLEAEEEQALATWTAKRQEVEALVKLKEKQFEQWKLESEQEEQKALDEWANTRREAA